MNTKFLGRLMWRSNSCKTTQFTGLPPLVWKKLKIETLKTELFHGALSHYRSMSKTLWLVILQNTKLQTVADSKGERRNRRLLTDYWNRGIISTSLHSQWFAHPVVQYSHKDEAVLWSLAHYSQVYPASNTGPHTLSPLSEKARCPIYSSGVSRN